MVAKRTFTRSSLESVRDKMKRLGITKEDVGEAIQWARSRKSEKGISRRRPRIS